MDIIWYTVLLRAIPEALGKVLLTLAINNEKRNIKKILLASFICGLAAFVLRIMPLKFGIHTMLISVIDTFIISIILSINIRQVFKSVLVALIVLTVSEIVTVTLIEYFKGLQILFTNGVNTILLGIPSLAALYLTAYIIFRFKSSKK